MVSTFYSSNTSFYRTTIKIKTSRTFWRYTSLVLEINSRRTYVVEHRHEIYKDLHENTQSFSLFTLTCVCSSFLYPLITLLSRFWPFYRPVFLCLYNNDLTRPLSSHPNRVLGFYSGNPLHLSSPTTVTSLRYFVCHPFTLWTVGPLRKQ